MSREGIVFVVVVATKKTIMMMKDERKALQEQWVLRLVTSL